MGVEQKLEDLAIKKILVVDDLSENIEAAKQYFQTIKRLEVDYCNSGLSAIDKIEAKTESKDEYDLIMSDLEMERADTGLIVIREGFRNYTLGVIVTGKNYDRSDDDAHGPSTTILPTRESVSGKKDDPEVWKQLFEKTIIHYEQQAPLRSSLERSKKYSNYYINSPQRTEPVVKGIIPFLASIFLEKYD